MKKHKVVIAILLSFVLLFSLTVPLNNLVKAGNGYGLVIINGKQMYMDKQGSLLPVYTDNNGKKYVEFFVNGDNAKASLLIDIKTMIRAVKMSHKFVIKSGSFPDVVYVYNPVSYSQTYSYYGGYYSGKWANVYMGTSKTDTIGRYGCFVTSAAMMLSTYGLEINNRLVNPMSLNTWLTYHNGYSKEDSFIFSSLNNFSGISYTYTISGNDNNDTSYSDAYMAIYNRCEPLIVFKYNNRHYHCCAFIQTDGVKNHTTVNKIINPDNHNHPEQIGGITETIEQSGLPWWRSLNPRFLVAVPSN